MSEWKLFDGEVPHVSTAEFHAGRPRAAHLEQAGHRERLLLAAEMIRGTAGLGMTFCDLGCGDGGLLSLVQECFAEAWGYDFHLPNAAGWPERGVRAEYADVFGADRDRVRLGDVVALTEVLEHLADPRGVLAWVRDNARWLACSSPWDEDAGVHGAEHAWAWDIEGYANLITSAGWEIRRHEKSGSAQVVLARRP